VRFARPLLTSTSAAIALTVTFGTAAYAAPAPGPTLTKADVSVVSGLKKPLTRKLDADVNLRPALCFQVDQRQVSGPPAVSADGVTITDKAGNTIEQKVYEYGSEEAAASAFNVMRKRSRGCDQMNANPAAGKHQVQVLSTGRASVQYLHYPGLWTRELLGRPGVKDGIHSDEYSVNLLVGTTVQQVTLFMDSRAADVQRSATDTLALALAARSQP
jgi:hypothetical protein